VVDHCASGRMHFHLVEPKGLLHRPLVKSFPGADMTLGCISYVASLRQARLSAASRRGRATRGEAPSAARICCSSLSFISRVPNFSIAPTLCRVVSG
jgi:hypothetical protein